MMMQSVVSWVVAVAASLGIRGGELNPVASHPAATSIVALLLEGKVHCSGVLIDQDLIVTAGHCIPPEGMELEIYFGHQLEEQPWDAAQIREATEWASYYHPNYQDIPELLMLKDLGWIKFTGGIPEASPGKEKIRPIEIAGKDALTTGTTYAIGGYGIDPSGVSGRRSGEVKFNFIPKFRSVGELAVVEASPSLPCPADSGSGLFAQVPGENGKTKWALIAIASEIFFDNHNEPDITYAQWSAESQCASATKAAYVIIGDDSEWLQKDSASFPLRVIPNDIQKFTDVPAPTNLRELCEYPNPLTSAWLTATAIIHAVRDQYHYLEPRSIGFCARFESYVTDHLSFHDGELTLSLRSDIVMDMPRESAPALAVLPVDFASLDLVPGLKRLVVEPGAELRGTEHLKDMVSLEALIFKGPVELPPSTLEVIPSSDLKLLDLTLAQTQSSLDYNIDMSAFSQIAEVNLTLEDFAEIPAGLKELPNLKHLTLRYSPEFSGPLSLDLSELTSLRSLSLSNFPQSHWSLGEIKALEHLFIWGGRLEEIALDSTPSLITLVSEGAPIGLISGELKNSQLKWWSTRFANLKFLPANMGELKELSYLDLKGNKLRFLPESFKELKELEFLNLSINELSSFPESLTSLQKLGYLDLSRNELQLSFTLEQAEWAGSLVDFVQPDSMQMRYSSYFKGSLNQRLSDLRRELMGFNQYSQRAHY